MNIASESNFSYHYSGGSLDVKDDSYVTRAADEEFYEALKAKDFCYVFHCRQMGKSSLRVRTMYRLQQEGIVCADLDLTGIVSQQTTPESWYLDIIRELVSCLGLKLERRNWWQAQKDLTPVHRFEVFIEEILLVQVKQDIVIFVDEIDSILRLNFQIDDFFQLIRGCYEKRANNAAYKRLCWALLGVTTPSELIKNPHCAPFNLGKGIELSGFQLHESLVLAKGLTNQADNPKQVLQQILYWTGGQPFLTQKLCWLVSISEVFITCGNEVKAIKKLVQERLIENWESQDEPPHLKTIRSRLLNTANNKQLLRLYEKVCRRGEIPAKNYLLWNYSNSSAKNRRIFQSLVKNKEGSERLSLLYQELQLSGLVIQKGSRLRVYNPIYRSVFNQRWVKTQLHILSPESQTINGRIVGLVSVIVTFLVMGVRWLSILQTWELQTLDHLMRQLPRELPEERLLMIGADEQDISPNWYGYPLPDATLAQLLDKLQQYQPSAIGLDIIRDRPQPQGDSEAYQALVAHLQNNNQLITVCAFGNNLSNSIKPPPQSLEQQLGFVDVYSDKDLNVYDDTVRRYLLSRSPSPNDYSSACTTPYSLAWQLAYLYFDDQDIAVTTEKLDWKFGDLVVKRLQKRSGGYQNLDARGNQLLINYRKTSNPQKIAPQLTVRDILTHNDRFNPDLVRGKVILIGVTAASVKDSFDTPLGTMRGLYLHGHVVSQILSAVEDNRPLLWWLPPWGDALWVGWWSFFGGIIVWRLRSLLYLGLSVVISLIILYGSCWFLLTQGVWLPLVPSVLALMIDGGVLVIYKSLKLENNR